MLGSNLAESYLLPLLLFVTTVFMVAWWFGVDCDIVGKDGDWT